MKDFGVVIHNGSFTIFGKVYIIAYFTTEDLLFESNSYTKCEIWIAKTTYK